MSYLYRNNKLNLISWVYLSIIIILTFPLLRGYFIIRDWIFLSILSFLIVFFSPHILRKKSFIWLLAYFFIVILGSLSGDTFLNTVGSLTEFTSIFISGFFFIVLAENYNYSKLNIIAVATLCIAIITSLLTIPITIINPNSAVMMVDYTNWGETDVLKKYWQLGMTFYPMPHALPFIIPPLVYILKHVASISIKIVVLICISVFSSLIYFSGAATPLLMVIVILIVSFLINPNQSLKQNLTKIIIVGIVCIFFFNDTIILNIITYLQQYIPNDSPFYGKLSLFDYYFRYGESAGDLAMRGNLYELSWNTFFDNFLLGTNDGTLVGEHSFFIDRMAATGIIGLIPLTLFFITIFKSAYKFIPDALRSYYLLGVIFFIILGFVKNISGLEYWLYILFLLPSLCIGAWSLKEKYAKNL